MAQKWSEILSQMVQKIPKITLKLPKNGYKWSEILSQIHSLENAFVKYIFWTFTLRYSLTNLLKLKGWIIQINIKPKIIYL